MKKIIFDKNWKFNVGNFDVIDSVGQTKCGIFKSGVSGIDFDDSKWETVNLPHDYRLNFPKEKSMKNADNLADIPAMEKIDSHLTTIGAIIGRPAWYRKHFVLDVNEYENKEIYIKFDGAFRDYTVYLNNCYVGNHQSGYTECVFNITDFVKFDGENVLAVKINPTESEGWWYEGAGIYRHVWLLSAPTTHFDVHGVFVKSDVDLGKNSARLSVDSTIICTEQECDNLQITHTIIDENDNSVYECTDEISNIKFGENEHTVSFEIDAPLLWNTKTPHMYKIISKLSNGDVFEDNFGIRKIEFHKDKGFLLNGEQCKLKGMCLHQDHAGAGVAHFDGLHQFRIDILKEMGCNAVRTSHNNPAPEFLDCCDRNGILVMDENRVQSTDVVHLEELKSMLKRDRNHPSVVIYSIGNEENLVQHTPIAAKTTKRINNYVKQLDGTRPITSALIYWDFVNLKNIDDPKFCDLQIKELDVIGMNYCNHIWDDMHATYPDKPFISTEVRSLMQTRGVYFDNKARCQVGAFDPYKKDGVNFWKSTFENDYVSGMFVWTGFDYHGEPTPYAWPAVISQFGVCDLCGYKKDAFYYYQSAWTDEPMVHIAPHWNWVGKEDEFKCVGCFTNCDEIELVLNEKIIERKSAEKYGLTYFEFDYEPGILIANAYKDGKLMASDTVQTTNSPTELKLELLSESDDVNGEHFSIFKAYAVDECGREVPDAQHNLQINLSDALKLVGVGNGDPRDHLNERECFVNLFNGLAQIIVKNDISDNSQKSITISTPSLKSAKYEF